MITLPTLFVLAQSCRKIEMHLTWQRSVVKRLASGVNWKPRDPRQQQSRSGKQGMATTSDLLTLQQQIRHKMADSLQRVREEMHTAINGGLDGISSISSAMEWLSAGPAKTAKPYRSSDLIPKSWDNDRASSGTSWQSCTCGMHAWSDQDELILVRVAIRWNAQHWL